MLKWAVTEKLRDYLLDLKLNVYTNNNPPAYIKYIKLWVTQIQWLSKSALFTFDIKYHTGKSNQAANTLSCHPRSNTDISSDAESEEYETISYIVVSDDLISVNNGIHLPIDITQAIQQGSIPDEPRQNKKK